MVPLLEALAPGALDASVAAQKAAKNSSWGSDQWECPYCGTFGRRSNKSYHLRRCPRAPTSAKSGKKAKRPATQGVKRGDAKRVKRVDAERLECGNAKSAKRLGRARSSAATPRGSAAPAWAVEAVDVD